MGLAIARALRRLRPHRAPLGLCAALLVALLAGSAVVPQPAHANPISDFFSEVVGKNLVFPDGMIDWLLTVEDPRTGRVAALQGYTSAIAIGLLGAVMSWSVVGYWLAGVARDGGMGGVEGLLRSVGALVFILMWPWVFDQTLALTNLLHQLLMGFVEEQRGQELGLLVGIEDDGQASEQTGEVTLLITLILSVIGGLVSLGVIGMKLLIDAVLPVLFVGMPLAVAFWPLSGATWVAGTTMRGFVGAHLVVWTWILVWATARAMNLDGLATAPENVGMWEGVFRPLSTVVLLLATIGIGGMVGRLVTFGGLPLTNTGFVGGFARTAGHLAVGTAAHSVGRLGFAALQRHVPVSLGGSKNAGKWIRDHATGQDRLVSEDVVDLNSAEGARVRGAARMDAETATKIQTDPATGKIVGASREQTLYGERAADAQREAATNQRAATHVVHDEQGRVTSAEKRFTNYDRAEGAVSQRRAVANQHGATHARYDEQGNAVGAERQATFYGAEGDRVQAEALANQRDAVHARTDEQGMVVGAEQNATYYGAEGTAKQAEARYNQEHRVEWTANEQDMLMRAERSGVSYGAEGAAKQGEALGNQRDAVHARTDEQGMVVGAEQHATYYGAEGTAKQGEALGNQEDATHWRRDEQGMVTGAEQHGTSYGQEGQDKRDEARANQENATHWRHDAQGEIHAERRGTAYGQEANIFETAARDAVHWRQDEHGEIHTERRGTAHGPLGEDVESDARDQREDEVHWRRNEQDRLHTERRGTARGQQAEDLQNEAREQREQEEE